MGPRQGPPQGEGRQPDRRGRPRGPHRDLVGEAPRPAVRGPDEDQTGERLDALPRRDHRQRSAHHVARRAPRRRQAHLHEGLQRREGAHRRAPGARPHATQVVPGERVAPRQARRLPAVRPCLVRALHRRGRLGRRFGQERTRPRHPGHPAHPRQDPERGEGAAGQDPAEQRDPGAHHGHRHRHRRGVRSGEGAVPPHRAHGRRRRRRRAHPHAAAHVLLPVHARS